MIHYVDHAVWCVKWIDYVVQHYQTHELAQIGSKSWLGSTIEFVPHYVRPVNQTTRTCRLCGFTDLEECSLGLPAHYNPKTMMPCRGLQPNGFVVC